MNASNHPRIVIRNQNVPNMSVLMENDVFKPSFALAYSMTRSFHQETTTKMKNVNIFVKIMSSFAQISQLL